MWVNFGCRSTTITPGSISIIVQEVEGKAVRTANPVQTTAVFGVKRGYCRNAVDGGNPFPRKEDGREYQTLMIGDM